VVSKSVEHCCGSLSTGFVNAKFVFKSGSLRTDIYHRIRWILTFGAYSLMNETNKGTFRKSQLSLTTKWISLKTNRMYLSVFLSELQVAYDKFSNDSPYLLSCGYSPNFDRGMPGTYKTNDCPAKILF
jgi:hypothetical protein